MLRQNVGHSGEKNAHEETKRASSPTSPFHRWGNKGPEKDPQTHGPKVDNHPTATFSDI